jgi:hypothetical protein
MPSNGSAFKVRRQHSEVQADAAGRTVKTVTVGHGTEFHGYKEIEKHTGARFYFATPYHSWERGTSENTNGLIQQYFPKRQTMKHVTPAHCDRVAAHLEVVNRVPVGTRFHSEVGRPAVSAVPPVRRQGWFCGDPRSKRGRRMEGQYRRFTTSLVVAGLVSVAFLSWAPRQAMGQSVPEGFDSFQRMVDYLAGGSGRWRAPNPRHDPTNDSSPEAIGLWFQSSARGHLLQLTVVFHIGSATRTGEHSYWLWHPGRREILYHEVSPNGAVRMGTTHFTDENTFVTLTEAVSNSGNIASNRGENVILGENAHRTTAYAQDAEGNWIEQNGLTWTRTPPRGG